MKVKIPLHYTIELRVERPSGNNIEIMSESGKCGEIEIEVPKKYLKVMRLVPGANIRIDVSGYDMLKGGEQ